MIGQRAADLAGKIKSVSSAAPEDLRHLQETAMADATSRYDWELVTDRYEKLFSAMRAASAN